MSRERALAHCEQALIHLSKPKGEWELMETKVAVGALIDAIRELAKGEPVINPEWVRCLEQDIEAYRGALGYSIPGTHNGKLSDGTIPVCGICNSEHRKEIERKSKLYDELQLSKAKPTRCSESVVKILLEVNEACLLGHISDESTGKIYEALGWKPDERFKASSNTKAP